MNNHSRSRKRSRRYRGAGVLLYRGGGQTIEVFLGLRRFNPFAGHWSVPGGAIDPGDHVGELEPSLTAALRELREETGVSIDVTPDTIVPRVRLWFPGLFEFHTFILRAPDGLRIGPISEFVRVDWFRLDALPAPLHIGVGRAIRALRRLDRRR